MRCAKPPRVGVFYFIITTGCSSPIATGCSPPRATGLIIIAQIIIIIIEGSSLLQSISPTTANKQTQTQMSGGRGTKKLVENC